tara:strand:- start:888 stop:3236 length:2349 start_codon:yes stop_codon:yes gene_type:complete
MTHPKASDYPTAFDTDDNLYEVHDSLRLVLLEDYTPKDTKIKWTGDLNVALRFPDTGIITLTEQCTEPAKDRAISFHYKTINFTDFTFEDITLLENFKDLAKPKRITNITLNVMAYHHNTIKDAAIAIERFIGVKDTIDLAPFGDTLEGRINFLRKLVLVPRAWFTSDRRTGLVPLEVEFKDLSFRLATDSNENPIIYVWDFGDNTTSTISMISQISVTNIVPAGQDNVTVKDLDGGTIKKTYTVPGIYDVKLTVTNDFGTDTIILPELINARLEAPDEAVINFLPNSADQDVIVPGQPVGGPYADVTPVIRSPINTLIQMEIPLGKNTNVTDKDVSFSGELLDGNNNPIDPVQEYTWNLGDDITHTNSLNASASYAIGGIYDLKLRVDTQIGAYRITTYEDSFDIIENVNLWLWIFKGSSNTIVNSTEYGLISETFKATSIGTLTLSRNDAFLDGVPEEAKQKAEFKRNTAFVPRGTIESGKKGTAFMFYATGRTAAESPSVESINVVEFNGFETGRVTEYTARPPITNKPWNWAQFNTLDTSYFLFGASLLPIPPNQSPVNPVTTAYSLLSQTQVTTAFGQDNFLNGADELLQNVSEFATVADEPEFLAGTSKFGDFSVYRTTSRDNTGFILRNDGVGPFFRIRSFYQTEGTLGDPLQSVRKLQDMQGPTRVEGELVNLSTGVFFINNSGSISAYSETTGVWTTGGPGINSSLYRALQDTSVQGFDSPGNRMLASSDNDRRAYITFDYSPSVFMKFNEIDLTFSSLVSRPIGEQFMMGVY